MMLQLDSLDDSIEGWEPPTYEELHQVEYPPDVQKMVEESKGKITSDGIDLGKDIQAYDADSDGVCELASETAEWWGPEWETDEEDPRLDSMTPVCTMLLFLLLMAGCVIAHPTPILQVWHERAQIIPVNVSFSHYILLFQELCCKSHKTCSNVLLHSYEHISACKDASIVTSFVTTSA